MRIKATGSQGILKMSGNLENSNEVEEIENTEITPRKNFPTITPLSPWFPNYAPKALWGTTANS